MSTYDQLQGPRHQHVHRLLNTGGPATPPTLQASLQALRAPAASRRRPGRLALAGAVAVTTLAAVLVLALSAGSPSAPTVAEAATLATRAATAPSPTRDPARPTLTRASFAGVRYPDWKDRFGWQVAGQRADAIDGRATRTVFYRHTHHRIGYTVVSGEPLKRPAGAQRLVIDGVEMYRYRDGRSTVVTFVRNGHTCVLAGYVHFPSTLPKLASWNGQGAIRF
jgi:hypothetical protein